MANAAHRPIPFNKDVLKWARERQGRSYEQAAKDAGVRVEKVMEWESGHSQPTVIQARKLAGKYGRPFLEFFAKSVPEIADPELVPDFRLYQDAPEQRESIALRDVQSWAETQRLNLIDLFEILGEPLPKFPENLFATRADNPEVIATMAREIVGFQTSEQIGIKARDRDDIPRKLRAKIESLGVLVLKDSSLSKLRARGLCVFAETIPIIVFGNEAPSAQAFTLAHELGHIILKQSAIVGVPSSQNARSIEAVTERWCNSFAGAFLIPKNVLAGIFQKPSVAASSIDDNRLSELAAIFGVSRHAMLIRLVALGYVEAQFYWAIKRAQFLADESSYESFARSQYYGSRYRNANGDFYTGMVLEAWATGRITNHNAGEFMGIKNLEHLNAIRDHFGV